MGSGSGRHVEPASRVSWAPSEVAHGNGAPRVERGDATEPWRRRQGPQVHERPGARIDGAERAGLRAHVDPVEPDVDVADAAGEVKTGRAAPSQVSDRQRCVPTV